jgi:hypothetical protein
VGAVRLPAREVRHLRTDLHDRSLGVLNLMHDSYCTSDDALDSHYRASRDQLLRQL